MDTIAFARGVPSPDALPVDTIKSCIADAMAEDGKRILSYGTGGGYPPLRELLGRRHGVDPSQIIITNGSLQAFVFLVQQLFQREWANQSPVCVVENPTYDRPLLILDGAGVDSVGVALDDDGLDIDALDQATTGKSCGLIYTIPNFQNPAGATLSDSRRTQLLELAAERNLLVLEDDPYGLLHFGTPPPENLFTRESDATVLYASSFSKTVAPGLRVGYLVLPSDLAGRMEKLANDTYISPTFVGEAAVARFISDGHLEPNIERCRDMLKSRCDAMCAAIDEALPEATYVRPGGGYFLWLDLANGVDSAELLPVAEEHGVSYVPGSAFGTDNRSSLRLAFSYPNEDEITTGVQRLAHAIAAMPATT